jgi:hypothetical protein
MYGEGPEPSLLPPTGAVDPDGEVAGRLRYAVESSSGATLAHGQANARFRGPTGSIRRELNGSSRVSQTSRWLPSRSD